MIFRFGGLSIRLISCKWRNSWPQQGKIQSWP